MKIAKLHVDTVKQGIKNINYDEGKKNYTKNSGKNNQITRPSFLPGGMGPS